MLLRKHQITSKLNILPGNLPRSEQAVVRASLYCPGRHTAHGVALSLSSSHVPFSHGLHCSEPRAACVPCASPNLNQEPLDASSVFTNTANRSSADCSAYHLRQFCTSILVGVLLKLVLLGFSVTTLIPEWELTHLD